MRFLTAAAAAGIICIILCCVHRLGYRSVCLYTNYQLTARTVYSNDLNKSLFRFFIFFFFFANMSVRQTSNNGVVQVYGDPTIRSYWYIKTSYDSYLILSISYKVRFTCQIDSLNCEILSYGVVTIELINNYQCTIYGVVVISIYHRVISL